MEIIYVPTTIPFNFCVSCLSCWLMMAMASAVESTGTAFSSAGAEFRTRRYREQLSSNHWSFLNHSCKQTQVSWLQVEHRSPGRCSLSVASLPEAALQTHPAETKWSLPLWRCQDCSAAARSRWCSCHHTELEEEEINHSTGQHSIAQVNININLKNSFHSLGG